MGAPECRDLEPLLQPYVDGEFEPGDRADVETHLAHCPACRALVESERRLRLRLREAAQVSAPPALRLRIESGLHREARWGAVRRVVRPELLAALAACAGFLAFLGWKSALEPLLEDAVRHHQRNLPFEVQGDETKVKQWFADKVDFNVELPHFRNLALAGARLSNVRDHQAAYVVYGAPNQAHRVSLFVFDDPRAPLELGLPVAGRRERVADREVVLANARGYNVAVWHDNEIVYSLVSDLDERDILSLLQSQARAGAPVGNAANDLPAVPVLDRPAAAGMVSPASLRAGP